LGVHEHKLAEQLDAGQAKSPRRRAPQGGIKMRPPKF
jgi:hypothetical protein